MRKYKFKKLISLSLVFLILLTQMVAGSIVVQAATSLPDVKLSSYQVLNKTNIYMNDSFDMTLSVENLSDVEIKDVYIVIDNDSSILPKNSGSMLPVGNIAAKTKLATTSIYTYDGGSNKLSVTIKYTKGTDSYEQTDFITISEATQFDNTPTAPVDTSKYVPKIVISNNSTLPTGNVGSKITYTLPIKNSGLYSAKNIVISPVFDDTVPFVLETMNISQTVESILPNETKDIKFDFTISSSAQVKNYPIKFKIEYYNTSNDPFSSTETGYIKIIAGGKLPKLSLESVSTNPSPVQAGENFKLDIAVKNEGSSSAKDVNITLLGLKNDGASIIGSSNKQSKANVFGGYTSNFTFDLSASSKIEIGANSLKIKLDYKDSTGSTFSDEIEFFYNVQDSSSLSNIELKNIVSPKSSLKPGDNAVIGFDIVNTGTADAQNVKLSISTDKEIIPRTLNTIILPLLKKGETKKIEFKMFVSDDALTKNYPVAINVEYDVVSSGTNTKQSAMQYIGLYVENDSGKSVPRLIIDSYSLEPGSIKAGENFTLKLSVLNTSKSSAISNIKVSLSSDDGTFTTINSN